MQTFLYKYHFPVTKIRKFGGIRMIEKTKGTGMDAQGAPFSYVPMDYRYLYPRPVSISRDSYAAEPFFPKDTTEICDYGLEQLMCQRQEIILAKTQMVLSEISQRYKLREENLYQIYLDQRTCRDMLSLVEDSGLDKRRIELEREIIGLEQEKRRERASYFRDILFLRKELRESLIEKLEEEQKTAMFLNQTGVSP
jgi:hypothetical protein